MDELDTVFAEYKSLGLIILFHLDDDEFIFSVSFDTFICFLKGIRVYKEYDMAVL